jgi:hypothetical protein
VRHLGNKIRCALCVTAQIPLARVEGFSNYSEHGVILVKSNGLPINQPIQASQGRALGAHIMLAGAQSRCTRKAMVMLALIHRHLAKGTIIMTNSKDTNHAKPAVTHKVSRQLFVEKRPEGDYAVRRGNSVRASDVLPTQTEAIARAKKLSSGASPFVERVRKTGDGKPDQRRKA